MKVFILFLLTVMLKDCLAATDTNILALGEWSQPVKDYSGFAIRGRLLMCQSLKHRGSSGQDVAVYLELQEYSNSYGRPVSVFCDFRKGFQCELYDSDGKVMQPSPSLRFNGPSVAAYSCILQSDSSARLRISPIAGCNIESGYLELVVWPWQSWDIPMDGTNAYYLSGTLNVAPTNSVHFASPDVWEGTLTLPKMKILLKQP